MAGLFDNIFGSAGGMYADMLSPEQQAAIRKQSMLQMAAKLLEGSGPSPVRRTLGQNLGSALSAGAEAVQSGQTNAVQQMLLKQKLDEAKMERDRAAQISQIFGAGQQAAPMTGVDAINAPAGGAAGPTMGRAAAIGTMPAGPSKADQAAKYRQAANVFAADPVKSKAYMDIADQMDPRPEVSGQPFEVTDSAGRPVMVQQMKDGSIRTMEGFGPKRDVVLQSLGGRMIAIDKNQLKGNESFAMEMTPGERASNQVALGNLGVARGNLSLAQKRFALDAAGGGSGGKPTEGQMGASGFATRMEAAEDIFSKIPAAQVPRFGMSGQSSIMSYFRSPEGQMAKQAADDWIRSKLRKESGAVIGEEEMEAEYKTYFPMPGDSAQVVAQKAQARQRATEAMKRNAGPAYRPYVPPAPAAVPTGLGTGTFNVQQYFQPPQ